METTVWSCFTCSISFEDQLAFFLHLNSKHPSFSCKFDVDLGGKSQQIYCHLCQKCFSNEIDHETRHFSTKIGAGSMIECIKCYRTFKTLDKMKNHCLIHEINEAKKADNECYVCRQLFKNRNIRDQHLTNHIPRLIEKAMDRIDDLQSKCEDRFTSNLCPLCGHVVSTRKSFKHHVVFQHLLRSQKDLDLLISKLDTINIVEEVRIVRKLIADPGLLWKRQVKQPKKAPKERKKQIKIKQECQIDRFI